MEFLCTATCLLQNQDHKVNLYARQGEKYDFGFDVRTISRHFKPLYELDPSTREAKDAVGKVATEVRREGEAGEYDDMKRTDLIDEAKSRKIPNTDTMRKQDIIRQLEEYDELNQGSLAQ